MNRTWTSGAIELLEHAAGHLKLESAFDKRIAFISIDNAVEISVKTYLSLPKQFFGKDRPSRKEVDEAFNSFVTHVELLYKYAGNKLVGIDPGDIEHYHRVRNTLYHDGTGLAVDQQYIEAYFAIAKLLLKRLFDFNFESHAGDASLENIITNWNKIEEYLSEIMNLPFMDKGTFKWEDAISKGFLTKDIVQDVTELRQQRNKLVHSKEIDRNSIQGTYANSVRVLDVIGKQFKSIQLQLKKGNYFYDQVDSSLRGTLSRERFFGPPGYGETPEIDMIENPWILTLSKPINIHPSKQRFEAGNFAASKFNITRIQLHSDKALIDLSSFEGQVVNVSGELWEAETGHHFTPVLLTVLSINR